MPRALLSVSDKTGLVELARGLTAMQWDLLSTGGTARVLRDAGLKVTDVSEATGFPEMLDGRVKTLHPAVHGGLLARRDVPAHMEALKAHKITPIDLVVVNLYPFRETAAKPGVAEHEVIENIDIGGPSMLRSAAKNFASVTVVVDPADYERVLTVLRAGDDDLELRRHLAEKAYSHTGAYDGAISAWFARARIRSRSPRGRARAARARTTRRWRRRRRRCASTLSRRGDAAARGRHRRP